jgi:hypothetical protein
MTGFDPYHKWLGIPRKDQPPNHYRLLAIEPFESDPDVIASAADQRMAHVRSFQTGKNSDLSQMVLNEIAAARVCLLNTEKKEQYDLQLRSQLTQVNAPPVLPKPLSATPKPASPEAEPAEPPNPETAGLDFIPANANGNPLIAQNARKQRLFRAFAVAAAVLVLVSITLAVIVSRNFLRDSSNPDDVAAKTQSGNETPKGKTPSSEEKEPLPKDNAPSKTAPVSPPNGTVKKPIEPIPIPAIKEKPKPRPKSGEPPQPATLPELTANKIKAPGDKERETILADLKEQFRDDYQALDNASDKTENQSSPRVTLARKLLQKTNDTRNNPALRYVLFQEAARLASEGGRGDLASQAIGAMSVDYDISPSECKEAAVQDQLKAAGSPELRRAAVEQALDTLTESIAEENISSAKQLSKLISTQARQLKEQGLLQEVNQYGKDVTAATNARAQLDAAITKLEIAPLDPDANAAAGKYYCLRKGQWEIGLPMLAVGTSNALRVLAEKDLKNPASADDQQKMGDDWWNYAQKEDEPVKRRIVERAGFWYQQALVQLTGSARDKLAAKLEQIDPNALPLDKWAKLLRNTRTECDSIHGKWLKTGAILTGISSNEPARIELPVEIDGAYDLQMTFSRQTPYVDGAAICVILPVGTAKCALILDTGKEHNSGIEQIDNKGIKDNPTYVRGVPLPSGRMFTVQISVRPSQDSATIAVQLENKPLLRWEGKQSSLKLPSRWNLPSAKRPGLGAEQCGAAFSDVNLRVISGKATWVPAKGVFYLTDLPAVQELAWTNPGLSPMQMFSSGTVRFRGGKLTHSLWARPFNKENSPSQFTYNLKRDFRQFSGLAALADSGNSPVPLTFRILGDDKLLWQSRPMQKSGESETFRVVVSNVLKLDLFVDCPGTTNLAHALWVEPLLTK